MVKAENLAEKGTDFIKTHMHVGISGEGKLESLWVFL